MSSSAFTQEAKDHWLLIARRLTAHEREICMLLLTALASGAREAKTTWSAEQLEEIAELTMGEIR